MTAQQALLAGLFAVMLAAFASGRWRLDVVAVCGLLAAVAAGLVPADAAFAGFGNPAVVTVAAVLMLTRALHDCRAVEPLTARALSGVASPAAQVAVLSALTAAASAFMNNIGALALFMPAALDLARRQGRHPGFYLMSLSYAALLGGMVTLIGTPANMLISGFRAQAAGEGFHLFAFAAVGGPLAILGVVYLALRAWWSDRGPAVAANDLDIPADPLSFDVELTVRTGSPLIGKPAAALAQYGRAAPCAVFRQNNRLTGLPSETILAAGDVVAARVERTALLALTARGGAAAEPVAPGPGDVLTEMVVGPNAPIQGSCALTLELEERFGVRLAAAARQGRRADDRLAALPLSLGDVLLLRGPAARAAEAAAELGCLVLVGNGTIIHDARQWFKSVWLTPALFVVAALAAAFEMTSPAVAFVGGVLAMVITGSFRSADAYRAVDWPVIVLLGAMLPLGEALQTTGLAAYLGQAALGVAGFGGSAALVAVMLAVTMLLTPVLNNPATVAVMAPVALAAAHAAGVSPDPLLMAAAVGASCDFLTPFGHHNNAVVMGPGGYRFGDYARLGWGLEALALAGGTGLIIAFWL